MWESRDAYRVWWRNLRERVHFGDIGVNGRIILKCIWGGGCTALIWFTMGEGQTFVNTVMNLRVA
jgi:hypothetical protein